MITAALTWPAAIVHVAWIAAVGLVIAVLIWSIFRTGRTAISNEIGQQETLERLRVEVRELRSQLHASSPGPETKAPA